MESGPPGDLSHPLPSVQAQRGRANGHPGASKRWWGSPEFRCCPTLVENSNLCHIHRSGRVTGTLSVKTQYRTKMPEESGHAELGHRCIQMSEEEQLELGVKHGKAMASEAQIIWLETSHYGPDGNSTSLVPTNVQNLLWPSAPGVLRGPRPTLHGGAWRGDPWVPQIVLALGKTVAVWTAHGESVLYSRQSKRKRQIGVDCYRG